MKVIEKINELTLVQDRVKRAIELREKIYKEFNDEIDELFANLKLK